MSVPVSALVPVPVSVSAPVSVPVSLSWSLENQNAFVAFPHDHEVDCPLESQRDLASGTSSWLEASPVTEKPEIQMKTATETEMQAWWIGRL